MFPTLDQIARNFRLADALDLSVVTIFFAVVFHWMRRRSNQALLLVVLGLVSVYLISHWLRMYLTLSLFRMGLALAVIGVLIIFQKDLRHGFERLAAWHPFSRRSGPQHHGTLISLLVEAVALFAKEKIGALIVLPARQDLERHLHGGERLHGQISVPLLHSIFDTTSPGHDGAAVIRGNLVDWFGVQLPLSTNFSAIGVGGTRHAAALGLAEQSDALVIVVSEERGQVSVAQNGRLQTLAQPADLASRLESFYHQGGKQKTVGDWVRLFANQLLAVVVGFTAAFFLWLMFALQVASVQRVIDQVPVEIHNLPPDWVIESLQPQQLRVNVMGSERAFAAFDWSTLRVRLDMSQPASGSQTVVVGDDAINLPEEISLVRAEPSVVRVTAYPTQTVELPVEVKLRGRLPPGWELVSKTPSVQSVVVKVRQSLASQIKAIPTKPIDLSEVPSSKTQETQLLLSDGVWPTEDMPTDLKVEFQLRRKEEKAPVKKP